MMISTKGDYGVRALIDLAVHAGEGPVQRAAIARRRQIPESYLDHLLAQLRRDGFIRSTRGPGGGHQLAKPAEEICLLHVLESLEGSLAPIGCVQEDAAEDEHDPLCGQQWVWRELYDGIRERLGGISVAELSEREQERAQTSAPSYSI
jgi:Rrf2 family cysteine metabolism transcriptional repressor